VSRGDRRVHGGAHHRPAEAAAAQLGQGADIFHLRDRAVAVERRAGPRPAVRAGDEPARARPGGPQRPAHGQELVDQVLGAALGAHERALDGAEVVARALARVGAGGLAIARRGQRHDELGRAGVAAVAQAVGQTASRGVVVDDHPAVREPAVEAVELARERAGVDIRLQRPGDVQRVEHPRARAASVVQGEAPGMGLGPLAGARRDVASEGLRTAQGVSRRRPPRRRRGGSRSGPPRSSR
jgi:hypothetical protein